MPDIERRSSIRLINAQTAFKDAPAGVKPAKLKDVLFLHSPHQDERVDILHSRLVATQLYPPVTIVAFTESSQTPGLLVKIGYDFRDEREVQPEFYPQETNVVRTMLKDKYGLKKSDTDPRAEFILINNGSSEHPFVIALNDMRVVEGAATHLQLSLSSSIARTNTSPQYRDITEDERQRPVNARSAQDFLSGIATLYDDISDASGVRGQVKPIIMQIDTRDPVVFISQKDPQMK